MKILVVGSGGREHALVKVLKSSPSVSQVICAPGNPGIAEDTRVVPVEVSDLEGQVALALKEKADLVVIGPEIPLAAGLADLLRTKNIPVFGPSAAAARIESSKAFAKDLMKRQGVPTARYEVFTDADRAAAFARTLGPCVVKADGLAAGKGVTVCESPAQAERAIREALSEGRFGQAGATVLVEEKMEGPEVSVFAVTDGKRVLLLPPAQDHKRLRDGDQGPNTGGMGAYAPAPILDARGLEGVRTKII